MRNSNSPVHISSETSILLPGYIQTYALTSHGFLYGLTASMDRQSSRLRLIGKSLTDSGQWEAPFEFTHPVELRVDQDHHAWIAQRSDILVVDPSGTIVRQISFEMEEDQEIGSFLLEQNCLYIQVQGNQVSPPHACILKTTLSGRTVWETPIDAGKIAYQGVVYASVATGWKTEPMPAWDPTTWISSSNQGIQLSENRLLVSYQDISSGIGRSYCLDSVHGTILWESPNGPSGGIVCTGNGEFVIQQFGYGAMDTNLYTSDGHLKQHWRTTGPIVIDSKGNLLLSEWTPGEEGAHSLVELNPDGTISRICALPGYWMVRPLIDEHDTLICWRNEQLQVVDAYGKQFVLSSKPLENYFAHANRMLLYGQGTLIFGLDQYLYILHTNLGRIGQSNWPCHMGNMRRNPAG
ncbi:MAG: hypothetical protein AAF587_16865 [Bacteroidota bacterium]